MTWARGTKKQESPAPAGAIWPCNSVGTAPRIETNDTLTSSAFAGARGLRRAGLDGLLGGAGRAAGGGAPCVGAGAADSVGTTGAALGELASARLKILLMAPNIRRRYGSTSQARLTDHSEPSSRGLDHFPGAIDRAKPVAGGTRHAGRRPPSSSAAAEIGSLLCAPGGQQSAFSGPRSACFLLSLGIG